jgi:hypothetical protein
MTLAIAVGNPEYAIVASDRRLTREIGGKIQILEDESNKAIILTCINARVVVTYTGLAQIGSLPIGGEFEFTPPGTFRTVHWLLDALREAGRPDGLLMPTLVRFRDLAQKQFESLSVGHPHKALTVSVVGFQAADPGSLPFAALISNARPGTIESSSEFRIEWVATDRASYVLAIGTTSPISKQTFERIEELSVREKPVRAPEGLILGVIRDVADDPRARGYVGKQCSVVAVCADPSIRIQSLYATARTTSVVYEPSQLDLRVGAAIKDVRHEHLSADGAPRPVAGPALHPRQPCWCGSQRRFEDCHGERW